MGKKLFSVILSIVLCLSLSISAFAQEAGTTTTFAMEGKEYTLYVRDNVSVVTEVETGVRASFDNSTYILTIYDIHSGRFKYRTTSNTHMKLITHRL